MKLLGRIMLHSLSNLQFLWSHQLQRKCGPPCHQHQGYITSTSNLEHLSLWKCHASAFKMMIELTIKLVGDEEGRTLMIYKRFREQRNPKPHVPYKKREVQAGDSKVAPKGKGTNGLKRQRKWARLNELLQKKGPPIGHGAWVFP